MLPLLTSSLTSNRRARSLELSCDFPGTLARFYIVTLVALGFMTLAIHGSLAAASAGCDGGGFSLLGLSGSVRGAIPANVVPNTFLVKGKYVEFTVDAATFGVRD